MSDVITSIEAGRSRSWVDPIGARELSSLVQRELRLKFQAISDRGGKVYFTTLTYDPAPWLPDGVAWGDASSELRSQSAEKCWDAMTSDRHVHHFIQRLEAATGLSLSGRWWSKREFTKNGFLHHHLIIDGPEFLPFDQVHECWGFGRIDCQVARSDGGLAWYVGSYCTKFGDEPPQFIMDRPAGSLRFTTCSDGWWSSDLGKVRPARRVTGEARLTWRRSDRAEDKAYGCYETVGMRIARKARSVTVRCNGEREEVQGVSLEDFRYHRSPDYERDIVKARKSMDAIAGLPLTQACRELRMIADHVRKGRTPGCLGDASVSDAGPQTGGRSCGPVPSPLLPPLYLSGPSSRRGEKTPPGRDPAAGGIAAATGEQGRLFAWGVSRGRQGPSTAGASRTASQSELSALEVSGGVARGLLTLSSPQQCIGGIQDQSVVALQGIPPDY